MIPVVVLLVVGFLWSLWLLGGLYASHASRRKLEAALETIYAALEGRSPRGADFDPIARHHPPLREALKRVQKHQWKPVHAEKILADFQLLAESQLRGAKLLTRLCPMLGLMGTLIPMGPALVGLAAGDIASMAANMQVAFATTVVGVFGGGVGYLVHLIKKRWCVADVNTLQYILEWGSDETA